MCENTLDSVKLSSIIFERKSFTIMLELRFDPIYSNRG